ncbi:MAG: hrp [Myxococcaceae bacterium]|nr:hrp [Myxococcaceae bacterium]
MKATGTVGAVLRYKGFEVWTISPRATVFEAISIMAQKNVGALLVTEEDQLVGVISERDYTRNVVLKGRASRETLVSEILSPDPIWVSPRHEVAECLRVMTENRIRHLPVLEDGQIVGVVSIGDLVNWTISAQDSTIEQLENYITGTYPA